MTSSPAANDDSQDDVRYAALPADGDLVGALRWQAAACGSRSPLYVNLLAGLAADVEAGGPTAALLDPYRHRPAGNVPALRMLAAVHRLVLDGKLPTVAPYFPSVGGDRPASQAWPALKAVLAAAEADLAPLLALPVQTNETGRASALYGALSVLAHRFGLPVRLFEIGASAGLNLRADHFGYRVADGHGNELTLGDPASPLIFDQPWIGLPPAPLLTPVRVVERRGCDPSPVDIQHGGAGAKARLESLVWADDLGRLARLRAAIAVARQWPAAVDAADDTAAWLADRLAAAVPGTLTVVWHSVVQQYVEPAVWAGIDELLDDVGATASADTPLARVSFEPELDADRRPTFVLRLTTWPGGHSEALGRSNGHGLPVAWAAGPARDEEAGLRAARRPASGGGASAAEPPSAWRAARRRRRLAR